MRNSSIKKYIPVYQRTVEVEQKQKYPFNSPKTYMTCPQYEHGVPNFWTGSSSRKPKVGYTVRRLRSRRAGQLELFPVLNGARSRFIF